MKNTANATITISICGNSAVDAGTSMIHEAATSPLNRNTNRIGVSDIVITASAIARPSTAKTTGQSIHESSVSLMMGISTRTSARTGNTWHHRGVGLVPRRRSAAIGTTE